MKSQKNNPIISIIIPLYGHEEYVAETLNYIKNQTFADFEVICVDDKSPDGSAEIVKKFAKKDDRFKLFVNKKNLGTSGTRNEGLAQATGKYIAFLDDDDIYHENMLAEFYRVAEDNDVSIVGCKYDDYYVDTNEIIDASTYWKYIPNKELLRVSDMPEYWTIAFRAAPWCKLYRRDLLEKYDVRFKSTAREDTIFSLTAQLNVDKIGFVHEKLLTHRHGHKQQTNDASANSYYKNMNWWPELKEIRKKVLATKKPKLIRGIDNRVLDLTMHTFNQAVVHSKAENWAEYISWVKDVIQHCGWDKRDEKYVLSPNEHGYRDAIDIVNGSYLMKLSIRAKELELTNQSLNSSMQEILSSRSWKITKPLRSAKFPKRGV